MQYPPKPPTPQIVGAILKRAGFNRAQMSASRVRGMKEHTEGYVVRKAFGIPDAVEVAWWPLSFAHYGDMRDRRSSWLQRYADAITIDPLYHGRLRSVIEGEKVIVYARKG